MNNKNIMIGGKGGGRIATVLSEKLLSDGFNVMWTGEVLMRHNDEIRNKLSYCDIFVASAWNTNKGYKTDTEGNIEMALATRKWLKICKSMQKHSIYFGCDDNSGFEDCPYKVCKDSCDNCADWTIKIPFVWQPDREGSLPWKIANGEHPELVKGKFVYVTQDMVVNEIYNHIKIVSELHNPNKFYDGVREIFTFDDIEPDTLENWILKYGKQNG